MATALGGISSPSACVASSTRMPSRQVLHRVHQVSAATAAGGHLYARQGLPRPAIVAPSRRSPPRAAAAAESLQAVEESDPEPVEAQIASVVASEKPKGEEVFAVIMVSIKISLWAREL